MFLNHVTLPPSLPPSPSPLSSSIQPEQMPVSPMVMLLGKDGIVPSHHNHLSPVSCPLTMLSTLTSTSSLPLPLPPLHPSLSCRHAYQIWPEQMPVNSVVMLSGKDSIVPSHHVRALLASCPHVRVTHNEEFHHAQFLFSPQQQRSFLTSLMAPLQRKEAST